MNLDNAIMNLIRESKTNLAIKNLLHWYAASLDPNESYVFQEQLKQVLFNEKNLDNPPPSKEAYIPL